MAVHALCCVYMHGICFCHPSKVMEQTSNHMYSTSHCMCVCVVTLSLSPVSDDGWLHRAVEVKGHLHIIEELQLFDQPQPVDSLVISHTQVHTHKRTCRHV